MSIYLKRLFFKILGHTPATMPMVQYWKTKTSVAGKIMRSKSGHDVMQMEGEKYPFPGYPRGYLLFGKLSRLKHEIKNQIFNDLWHELDLGFNGRSIAVHLKREILPRIYEVAKETQYDHVPPERMNPAIREIYRAWTKACPPSTFRLRDILCFILQEDDAYRFRMQWLVMWFGLFKWFKPIKAFDKALMWLERGESIDDMKERQRLLRRVSMALLEDERIRDLFVAFFREVNWRKVALTKGDKFHFRGKYFRVDLDKFEY